MLKRAIPGSRRSVQGPVIIRRGQGRAGVGYAVGKNVGNAVTRNKVRRRLREAVRLGVDPSFVDGTYLVSVRAEAAELPFSEIAKLVVDGIRELHGRG